MNEDASWSFVVMADPHLREDIPYKISEAERVRGILHLIFMIQL